MISKIMNNGINNVHRFVDPVGRFVTSGFGLPALLGLGARAVKQLLDWSVFGPLRLCMRLLRQLKLFISNLLALVAQGLASAGADDPTMDIVGNLPLLFAAKSVALQVDAGSPGIVDPGDTLRYTVTIYNNGAIPATLVELYDEVPADTTYVADSVTLNGAGYTATGSTTTACRIPTALMACPRVQFNAGRLVRPSTTTSKAARYDSSATSVSASRNKLGTT